MNTKITYKKILIMPAGREIDTLVAEMVMGWKFQPVIIGGYQYFKDEKYKVRYVRNDVFPGLCWLPSQRIADAWEVIEKMKKTGHNFRMIEYVYDRTYVTFDDEKTWIEANGKNCTPLAICRAALLTVVKD